MKRLESLIVPNTVEVPSVRMLIYSSLAKDYLTLPFTISFVRVGRLVVELETRNHVNWSPKTQRLMLVRMLIAVKSFHRFLPDILRASTPQVNSLVTVYERFLWKRLRKKSIPELLTILQADLKTMYQQSLIFRYPNTLLIDGTLSSRDILGLLVVRFLSFWREVSTQVILRESPIIST